MICFSLITSYISVHSDNSEFQEIIACLKEEGIPDECLSFLNTGVDHEKCQEKLNEKPVAELETTSNKCFGVSNTGG